MREQVCNLFPMREQVCNLFLNVLVIVALKRYGRGCKPHPAQIMKGELFNVSVKLTFNLN